MMKVARFKDVGGTYGHSQGEWVRFSDYKELEAENARLRQQRDAANAQLDFLIEEMEKAP
ncbi:hypothetical protein PXW39_004373 [Salmonella enterica]|nr:hypothetical protein [Salmonella enterica]